MEDKLKFNLKTIRSVTPNSLIMMTNLSKEQCNSNYIYLPTFHSPLSSQNKSTTNKQAPFRLKENIKSNKSQMVMEYNSNLSKARSEMKSSSEIKYSDFKGYHSKSNMTNRKVSKSGFFKKNSSFMRSINKIRGNELDPLDQKKNSQNGNIESQLFNSPGYSRPALTYLEKLYRLKQVSIF